MQTTKVRPEPKIPDHEVLRKIGGGAYGEVWLARGVTGALRAVKTVSHNDFEDERGFEREFEGILKYEPISRDHPALVHILHVGRGEMDGEPFYYYVMELGDDVATGREINPVEYEARTLRSDMKAAEGRALDVEDCISAGRSLAEGLEHLHQNGLAHRDVKPSNVIFVDGKAKLADIGLVALRGQQTFVGTEGFVPPEGPGSAQADVYSLGKVLYEMATGKDRLDFPELPDELPEGSKLKRWRMLNSVICDVCEPRISRRKIKSAGELATELGLLEAGRRRPMRVRPGLIAAFLITAVGVVGATQLIYLKPVKVSSALGPPKPVEMGRVTIMSTPDDAIVIDEDGNELGPTPTDPILYPVDSIVKFTLVKPRHRDLSLEGEVAKEGLVLTGDLQFYSPPEFQSDWTDVFGTTYEPDGDHHVSRYYVSAEAWKRYRDAKNVQSGKIVMLRENGMENEVVLASQQEARRYARWLEDQCRDGYLDADHWIEPKFAERRYLQEFGPEFTSGPLPFYCVVRKQYEATIAIGSEPAGAEIFIDGESKGFTTEDGLEITVNLGKGAKSVQLILDKSPKYKRVSQLLRLEPYEEHEALIIPLELENIFSDQLQNSLGMKLVPVGEGQELLASIWETRIRDYQEYLEALKGRVQVPKSKGPAQDYALLVNSLRDQVKAPPEASFSDLQGDEHPVVNVTREDAERFCRWLTLKERKNTEFEEIYEYRLPTDAEWSMMAGLNEGEAEWPQELHGQAEGFFWGTGFPPPKDAGNFSDDSAICSQDLKILNYSDQFPYTSPVGRFTGRPVGKFFLYDLEGNVMEWVSDDYNAAGEFNVARGSSWRGHSRTHLKISARRPVPKNANPESEPFEIFGFRVVLAKVPVNTEKGAEEGSKK